MRCDLHVHSRFSGPADLPLLGRFVRECYSEPEAVYELAKRRGMDLVTLTDHDSIEGALRLAHRPDVFVSEEVTCALDGGRVVHLGVFDIDEPRHREIARRRHDAESLFAYLAEQRIPAAVNHLFSPLTGRRRIADFHRAVNAVAMVETQNGMMPAASNEHARRVARGAGLAEIGGSDGHTLAAVARAFTTVPRARTRDEFLAGLRQGLTVPGGRAGSYARLTSDVFRVFGAVYLDAARRAARGTPAALLACAALAAAAPLATLIPLVTLANFAKERLWADAAFARYRASMPTAPAAAQAA